MAAACATAISSVGQLVGRSATEVRGVADDMAVFEDSVVTDIRTLDQDLDK